MVKTDCVVIRRVGGLEVAGSPPDQKVNVIRRVGGLEEYIRRSVIVSSVIRRVGGLEVLYPDSA